MIQEIYFPAFFIALTVGLWVLARQDKLMDLITALGERTPEKVRKNYMLNLNQLGINIDPALLAGFRYGLSIGFILLSAVFIIGKQINIAFICLILAVLGWFIPSYWLWLESKKRRNEIERDFPYMVKLYKTFSHETNLETAITILPNVTEGELKRQLDMLLDDLATMHPKKALKLFAQRCNYDKIGTFCDVVTFGIETGTDISELLTTFAVRAQTERVNQERKKIKSRPVLMTIIPALMAFALLLLFGIPIFDAIINNIQKIG